jgi:hypothetical protein
MSINPDETQEIPFNNTVEELKLMLDQMSQWAQGLSYRDVTEEERDRVGWCHNIMAVVCLRAGIELPDYWGMTHEVVLERLKTYAALLEREQLGR